MYHKQMLLNYIVRPISEAFTGTLDFVTAKFIILLAGFPAALKLDLFSTPERWWKALLYLVILDWISGVITAMYRNNFSWNVAARKWYQAAGYIIICAAVAILSNGIPEIFYYFQFAVYATFFLKEFVSILRTWRMLAIFKVAWKMVTEKKIDIESFEQFEKEVKKRSQPPKKPIEEEYDESI